MPSPAWEVHAPFFGASPCPSIRSCSAADGASVQGDLLEAAASPLAMSLQDFVAEFGDELLDSLNRANPPVYTGQAGPHRQLVPPVSSASCSARKPGGPCRHRAAGRPRRTRRDRQWRDGLRQDHRWHRHGRRAQRRRLSPHVGPFATPPGLQVAARIQETVAGAKVWVLNGPDTLVKLIKLREQLGVPARARSSSCSGACGCAWFPLEARLQRCGARGTATWGMPGLRPGHHRPRRRADQPGRTRSRGLPPPASHLRRTAVDADATAELVRKRPVPTVLQSLEAHPDHRGSHRAEADAEVRRRLPGVDARGQHPRVHQPDG